jgi:hypothetical protein
MILLEPVVDSDQRPLSAAEWLPKPRAAIVTRVSFEPLRDGSPRSQSIIRE